MKFLGTTAKLAGGLAAAFLLSTAVANAAPARTHDAGPRIERHDTRGAPAKPHFDSGRDGHKEGRQFARIERHGFKHDCAGAHRHVSHERHAHAGKRHGHHRMAAAGKRAHPGHDHRGHDRDHDRRG